ncbi:MAG: hypothetical protein FJX36_17440 [Alphaproteobacteria bacterium]|nr:hypothetical protein [Alphaproteobacteria bacterium]
MKASKSYSPEVRERAVRMVFEHEGDHASQWAAIRATATAKGASATPEICDHSAFTSVWRNKSQMRPAETLSLRANLIMRPSWRGSARALITALPKGSSDAHTRLSRAPIE